MDPSFLCIFRSQTSLLREMNEQPAAWTWRRSHRCYPTSWRCAKLLNHIESTLQGTIVQRMWHGNLLANDQSIQTCRMWVRVYIKRPPTDGVWYVLVYFPFFLGVFGRSTYFVLPPLVVCHTLFPIASWHTTLRQTIHETQGLHFQQEVSVAAAGVLDCSGHVWEMSSASLLLAFSNISELKDISYHP